MNIEIVTRNVNNEVKVREDIQDRIQSALDRFDTRISGVIVRLEDESRNSSAFVGLCQIDVMLQPSGHLHVSAHGESVLDCVLQAIRKMEAAVKHDIDRHRRSAKIRHQNAKRTIMSSLTGEGDSLPPE